MVAESEVVPGRAGMPFRVNPNSGLCTSPLIHDLVPDLRDVKELTGMWARALSVEAGRRRRLPAIGRAQSR